MIAKRDAAIGELDTDLMMRPDIEPEIGRASCRERV